MSVKYVLVSDEEYGEAVELPLEDNGTLLLSTLTAQFPGASGLKFRTENNVVRGVRLADGRFHVPDNEWGKTPYYCVFPKGNFMVLQHFLIFIICLNTLSTSLLIIYLTKLILRFSNSVYCFNLIILCNHL